MTEMSKRQMKIAKNKEEQEKFLEERAAVQFALFERNFLAAKEVYEREKEREDLDDATKSAIEAQIAQVEKEIAEYHEKHPTPLLP